MEMNCQTAKTELIAIYRLEFYKNKKNWKLCSDVRKPPPRTQSPTCKRFNQTYDVPLEADLEPEPPLNQAFLNEVPVDEPYNEPYDEPYSEPYDETYAEPYAKPYSESYAESYAEPYAKPYTEPYAEPLLRTQPHAHALDQAWSNQQWVEPGVEDQEWCGDDAEGVPEECAYQDVCDGRYEQRLWPPAEQSQAEWSGVQRSLERSSPAELLALAEDWLRRRHHSFSCCDQCPLDSDNSTDFVRGAHLAPHSSETDLSITHDECPCMSRLCVRTASAGRLARALLPHAAALRHILHELALRDTMRPPSPFVPANQFEERPTRDTDPPHSHERLLAASHLPTPTPTPTMLPPSAGRGRGRGRLIGLNMGRPYRL